MLQETKRGVQHSCTIIASQAGLDEYAIEASAPKPWYAAPDVQRTFTIAAWPFGGFLAPMDNGKTNVAQAGSAVPVKFRLGGDLGLAIFAAGYPKSAPTACPSGAPQDPVEQTVAAGESSLSDDTLTGRYVYVWKTDKAWGGTCRQLDVKLADSTVHTATFQFKR